MTELTTERVEWYKSVLKDSVCFVWDEDAQPPWEEINSAVQELCDPRGGEGPPAIFDVPEPPFNCRGLLVSNWALTSDQVNEVWRHWIISSRPDPSRQWNV